MHAWVRASERARVCVCAYNRCASHVGVVLSVKVVSFPLADIGEGIFEAQVMKW